MKIISLGSCVVGCLRRRIGLRYLSSESTTCKKHYERRLLPYTTKQCYEVVADVSRYQEFVPWVKKSVILSTISSSITDSANDELEAELEVGFGIFTEKYISHVSLHRDRQVTAVSNQTNLFQNLKTEWKFTSSGRESRECWVSFHINFQFKSAVYNRLSELFLQDVIKNMVQAFEDQCKKRYGPVAKS